LFKQNKFDSFIKELTKSERNVTEVLDNIFKFAVNLVNNTEELREELIDQDIIIQINITDIDFIFWFKIFNGKVTYKKGFNDKATLKIEPTKDMMIKMIRGEISGLDAFMRGKLKASGSLSHGFTYIKTFRLIGKYLDQASNKKIS